MQMHITWGLHMFVVKTSMYATLKLKQTRNVVNAQHDGRPAEHRWRPLFNAAVWLTPTTRFRAVTLPRRETR